MLYLRSSRKFLVFLLSIKAYCNKMNGMDSFKVYRYIIHTQSNKLNYLYNHMDTRHNVVMFCSC